MNGYISVTDLVWSPNLQPLHRHLMTSSGPVDHRVSLGALAAVPDRHLVNVMFLLSPEELIRTQCVCHGTAA